jgi:hypothetical protein
MICDIIAFAVLLEYYNMLLKDDDIVAYVFTKDAKAADWPGEPEAVKPLRIFLLFYFSTNFLSYFAVNAKALLTKFPTMWSDPHLLAGVSSFLLILMFGLLLDLEEIKKDMTGEELLNTSKHLLGSSLFCITIKIVIQLKGTQLFGPLVQSIQMMLLKAVIFISLLGFVIIFFSSIFLARFFGYWYWNTKMEDTSVYLFHSMLGNYNTTDFNLAVYDDYETVIVFYLFLITTTIIMLNLFIAVLSDIYANFKYESRV